MEITMLFKLRADYVHVAFASAPRPHTRQKAGKGLLENRDHARVRNAFEANLIRRSLPRAQSHQPRKSPSSAC
jgi:hypothetical protein